MFSHHITPFLLDGFWFKIVSNKRSHLSADAKMSNPRINPVLDTFFRSCIFTLCLFPSDSNSYRLPDRKIRPAAACPSQKTCPNRQKFSNWTNFIGRHRKLNKFLFFLLIIYTFRILPRSTLRSPVILISNLSFS